MKKRRFYIKGQKDLPLAVGSLLLLSEEDSHHLRHVLRIGKGASIGLFDGCGREIEAVVDSFLPDGANVRITRVLETHGVQNPLSGRASRNPENNPVQDPALSRFNIDLVLPLLKADKLESVFRMASQLGANAFLLFLSKRCIPQPGDTGIAGKMKRWERIILDSIRISGRSIAPSLKFFDSLENLLKTLSEKKKIIIAHEQPGLPLLSDVLYGMLSGTFREGASLRSHAKNHNDDISIAFDGIALATGPEGGFSPEEVDMAVNYGAVRCSLGEGILKAETAPVAALAVVLSFLGRL
jgi:16S rRNA (uracil1498-N3)-methyltransferase